MMMKRMMTLAACMLLCFLPGALGQALTASSVKSWYPLLTKPSFTPPGWIFGPVWTILYAAMGLALFLVLQRRAASPHAGRAIRVFLVQLALNAAWSPAFFGLRSPGAGLVVILLLLPAIAYTVVSFHRVSSAAGWILSPYLAWVSFATVLNASIFFLNIQGGR